MDIFYIYIVDLQNVSITLRILFRPLASSLPNIFMNLGVDYDEKVLPSITREVLTAVVVGTSLQRMRSVKGHMLNLSNFFFNK